MAATRDMTDIDQRIGPDFGYPAKTGLRFYKKAILAVTAAGLAVPAGHADAVAIIGLVETHVDNRDGADGAQNVVGLKGIFGFTLAATAADIGKQVFAADDADIGFDEAGLLLGRVVGVEGGKTWIDVTGTIDPAFLTARLTTLVGTPVTRIISPVAGEMRKISSVIDGVLTTGDATITVAINGVAVTGGVITVTQAGSAAGDVDEAEPSALNKVAVGDVISFTVGGTNATATPASMLVEIAQ